MAEFQPPTYLGGEVAKGFKAAVAVIVAAAVVVVGLLLLRRMVRALSPRRLCEGCNRYYSSRARACPFCGEGTSEEEDETATP